MVNERSARFSTGLSYYILIPLLHLSLSTPAVSADDTDSKVFSRYPQDALECYSSSSPNKKIICPEDRNNFCVKEVADSSRRDCGGSSDYPLDIWDIKEPGGLCVYKKCSHSCPNMTVVFHNNNGETNSRTALCCTGNLCNPASRIRVSASKFIVAFATAIAFMSFIL